MTDMVIEYAWALLLVVTLAAGWMLTLFAMPGNWLMVAAAALYAWLMPPESRTDLHWWAVIALLVLAIIGEILEFIAAALGARRGGGSKRGAVLAVLLSIPGAMIGAAIGVPVPVVGSIIGVVLFAGLGALAGAMLGEHWKGRTFDESWQIGQGAFWGRILGSLAKVTIASIMLAVGAIAALWP
jgi:uncharacterized protein YqgC (DUF456 family)